MDTVKYIVTLKSGKQLDFEFAPSALNMVQNYLDVLKLGQDLSQVGISMTNAAGLPYAVINCAEIAAIEQKL